LCSSVWSKVREWYEFLVSVSVLLSVLKMRLRNISVNTYVA